MKFTMEDRLKIYARDKFRCQHKGCYVLGIRDLQLAHCIAQTESNAKMVERITGYPNPWDIINHPDNLKTSCSKHNPYFNIGNKPKIAEPLIWSIYHKIKKPVD